MGALKGIPLLTCNKQLRSFFAYQNPHLAVFVGKAQTINGKEEKDQEK